MGKHHILKILQGWDIIKIFENPPGFEQAGAEFEIKGGI